MANVVALAPLEKLGLTVLKEHLDLRGPVASVARLEYRASKEFKALRVFPEKLDLLVRKESVVCPEEMARTAILALLGKKALKVLLDLRVRPVPVVAVEKLVASDRKARKALLASKVSLVLVVNKEGAAPVAKWASKVLKVFQGQ